MKIHIVRPNERLNDISNKYNITIEEIKSANPHFRSWENIAPGAKINLPNIPQYKQRLEDIGKYQRKNLVQAHNLKTTFKAIRNYLAANTVGATRDEVLAQQLINIIFCKFLIIYF